MVGKKIKLRWDRKDFFFVVEALQKPIFCGDAMETLTVKEMKKPAVIKVKALQIYSSFCDDAAFITQAMKWRDIGNN